MTSQSKNDFSGERRIRWRLWLVVALLHVLLIMGLNASLTLNRLAAQAESSLDVALLPPSEQAAAQPFKPSQPPKPLPPQALPKSAPVPEAAPANDVAATLGVLPGALSESVSESARIETAQAQATTPQALPETVELAPTANKPLLAARELKTLTPAPVVLRYGVSTAQDSARAILTWRPTKALDAQSLSAYELSYEMTYFSLSIAKQSSVGVIQFAGLAPTRFAEKRRNKSEQATHFDVGKNVLTFSNNKPEAKLPDGTQDRVSFLIQLASWLAGQPDRFQTGVSIALPVASVDELELWTFEVQGSEVLALPVGSVPAIRLMRRPRKTFDTTVEAWFAPSYAYMPVRIRLTDAAGGVVDAQLTGQE